MIRRLSLHLIIGIIILKFQDISANNQDLTPAELCKNPLVTSATKTQYGVICLIPRPEDTSDIEKRQQFVRSLPKLLKAEQNDNLNVKLIPNVKLIQNQFTPQTNALMKRSIFTNWFQKFYESLYKTVYKSLRNSLFAKTINHSEQQQSLPQQSTGPMPMPMPMPLINPDQLVANEQEMAQTFGQHLQLNPNNSPMLSPQESQINFIPHMERPQIITADFSQHLNPVPNEMNSDINGESLPIINYNSEELAENEPTLDETRLGSAVHDLPHYNYGSVRQLATYLQSIQGKINRQKFNNLDEDKQTESSDFINDYRPLTPDSSNDKHEFVIPLYTDVKVREKSGELSEERSIDEVRRPRKLVYEFHGYKRDMDCKGRFKPLKSDSEKEQPLLSKTMSYSPIRSRRKRYIEMDYSQMQLRKLPILFNRNEGEENPLSEAIIEVKPRSLFRFEQPMLGWKPLVPPEVLRKDLFLKRNGDPDENWDHEQVESQTSYHWLSPEFNQTFDNPINKSFELKNAETLTIESLKNLDLSKSSVVIDRRNYGNPELNHRKGVLLTNDYYLAKEEQNYDNSKDLINNNNNILSTDKPFDNQVIGSDPQLDYDLNSGIKAVEVENVGEDLTKIRSLEEIAALPGAVIKPIDSKLTEILLKVLSHNSDFSQKRITNAYFLEFPKLPNYSPDPAVKSTHNYIMADEMFKQIPSQTQIPVETSIQPNYDLDYDKDIQLTESDYEYGEMVCANKASGGVADVRKGCRIYFQCTPYTIDTYVCPRGSIFDDRNQFCLPSNKVICGKYS